MSAIKAPISFLQEIRAEAAAAKKNAGLSYVWWQKKSEEIPEHRDVLHAFALTRPDGFVPFCQEIGGLKKLYEPFHSKMAQFVTGYIPRQGGFAIPKEPHPYRMLLAFRGSYKSTLSSINAPAWDIARDFVENDFERCNIRIGLGSERMKLARAHVRGVRRILESPRFVKYFGNHRSDTREGGAWSNDQLQSAYQDSLSIKDPTVMAFALGYEATGFHFNRIKLDDLQAFESSFSVDQLEKSWELYSLCHSLLDPGGEVLVVGTRWHNEDIYGRIIELAKTVDESFKFRIAVMPIVRNDQPTFPTEFPQEVIKSKRANSPANVWASQYLLEPIAEADRKFKSGDMMYMNRELELHILKKRLHIVTGVDPAWVSDDELRRGMVGSAAYSVVMTFAIDSTFNFYMLDCYRKRADRDELTREIWRQVAYWRSTAVGMQQVDYSKVYDSFHRHAILTGFFPPFAWLHSSSKKSKDDRIEGSLQGLHIARKIHLLRGLDWLEAEFLDFPYSKTKDGLDALVNVVKVAHAPKDAIVQKKIDETTKDIEEALYGEEYESSWENAY